MIICKRCGWEIIRGFFGWKDRMGHNFCTDTQEHEPAEKVSR